MSPTTWERLAAALERNAPANPATEARLRSALALIVSHPGKLVRAGLVLAAAERHGLAPAAAEELACAIEFFHAASLILDDLPCMDDAVTRRGQACVHRQHGEATAILAALALINRAYALIGAAVAAQPRRIRAEVNVCLDHHLGLAGLVGGQAWDLAFAHTDRSARLVSRIAAGKTGALFALALLLPAVLARPSQDERRHLHALCVYWSQLFQIADDLHDVSASGAEGGKSTGRDRILARPNLAIALGVPAARRRLALLNQQAGRTLAALAGRAAARWDYLQKFHQDLLKPMAGAATARTEAA